MSTNETTASATAPSVPNRTIYKLLVLLILAGGIAYSNSLTKGFYLDDALWIYNNDKIGDFTEYLYALRSRPAIAVLLHLNYRFHGLNVFGYHLVNMTIHVAAALCLFGVVRQTLLLPKWAGRFAGNAHWFAFATALLWEIHPLQTQAVTYIIQRCESLMGLFFLLTLYCFIRASQATTKWGWYLFSCLSCLGGASCKEVIVTVLPVMLCYDYVFLGTVGELIRRRAWFYAIIGALLAAPVLFALFSLSNAAPTASAGFALLHLPPHVYMMTQAWIVLHYIRLIFVPYPQSFSYRGWPLTTEFADFWPAGLTLGLLILLTAWLLYRRHWLGFLGAWFFGILSITSLVPLLDVGFEHRLYLPLAAFCVLTVFVTHFVLKAVFKGRMIGIMACALLCCAATTLIVLTMLRNEDYRNVETLWLSVNRLYPNEHESLNNIASGLADEERLDEAKDYYEKTLKLMPGMYLAEFGFGQVLCKQGELEKGLPYMLAALQSSEKMTNRNERNSNSNSRVALVYWMLGNLKAAEEHQRKAINYSPKNAAAYGALAMIVDRQNRHDEARQINEQALQLAPHFAESEARHAEQCLHGALSTSKWKRKEALFHASVAALASGSKNPTYDALLAEAYAANDMRLQAAQVAQKTLQSMDEAVYPQLRLQLERSLIRYQQQLNKGAAKN